MSRKTKQPAPVNAVATDSDLWAIQNYTRYKTSDLLALLNLVEEHIRPMLPAGLGLKRATRGYSGDSSILYVDTFTGGHEGKRTRWSESAGRVYVKSHGDSSELRIVAPERLGLSAVEELSHAAAGEEGTPVPSEVIAAIVGQMCWKYAGATSEIYGGNNPQSQWVIEPVIRIVLKRNPVLHYLSRPENKKPVRESGDPRLIRLATDKARIVWYAAQSTIRQLEFLERYSNTLNNYSKKRGQPSYADVNAIQDMLRIALQFEIDSEACKNALEQELKK